MLTERFAVNHRQIFRSIIDITIDLFNSEDRYSPWNTTALLCVYNPDHIWDRACACPLSIGQRICEHCDLNQIENEHHMIFVCPFYTDERKSLFENLSEFTSASWQPSFFTFKTILTMADGDPDFITPVCGFVDACFAKKKAIYELQMKLWYSQKCSHISVQPQSTPAFCGAPTASRQMGTHCGGVANDCRWLCPTYTRGCLYMWTPKCFNYLLTNVNCHQASYWILIL